MTSLLAHTVAQPTKWRFLPKNLNQLVIFVIEPEFVFWNWALFLSTRDQVNASPITKLTSWFKFLGKNLHLVGCATVCAKSEVMLTHVHARIHVCIPHCTVTALTQGCRWHDGCHVPPPSLDFAGIENRTEVEIHKLLVVGGATDFWTFRRLFSIQCQGDWSQSS